MTENTNGHGEAINVPADENARVLTLSDVLNAEGVTPTDIETYARTIAGNVEEMEQALTRARDRVRNLARETEHRHVIAQRERDRYRALEVLRERDLATAQEALAEAHPDARQVPTDSAQWAPWLRMAYRAGILAGNISDTGTLAWALDGTFNEARALFEMERDQIADSDGNFPTPVSVEQAVANAWTQYRMAVNMHPAHPALANGWRTIWHEAKSAGLCGVFDEMATALGVPRVHLTRSGTVRVHFDGYVDIHLEEVGLSDDDVFEMIDTDDIERALRNGDGYLDINEYDLDGLEVDE